MTDEFVYESLPTSELHIRLLRVLPQSDENAVNVELHYVRWADVNGTYDAISYMWGLPDKVHQVTVGDYGSIAVRDNIWRFLLHYKKTPLADKSAYLWIDSICINQQDIAEKSIQVAAMGSIFAGARRVLVWLGEASEKTGLNQSDIDYVEKTYADLVWPYTPSTTDWWQSEQSWRDQSTMDLVFVTCPRKTTPAEDGHNQRLREYLRTICCHPYWSRSWIVQEIHLARNGPKVIAGSLLLSDTFLGVLGKGALLYGRQDLDVPLSLAAQIQASFETLLGRNNVLNYDSSFEDGKGNSLVSMLHRYCLQGCYDSRDRIYGLLGLLDPKLPTGRIQVDYQTASWSLFLKVFDLILEESELPDSDNAKPVLSWVRWLAWALEIDSTVVKAVLVQPKDTNIPDSYFQPSSSRFRNHSAIDEQTLTSTMHPSTAFTECKFDISLSVPHTRLYPEAGQEPQSSTHMTVEKNSISTFSHESVGYRFKLWLQGRFQSSLKFRTQMWVCQLDEHYSFPLAIKPLSTGQIQILGYIAKEEPDFNKAPWKLFPLPPDIEEYLQNWFDRKISNIKQSWLQNETMHIPFSVLQLLQIAELSRKITARFAVNSDLLPLSGKPRGISI